MRRSSETGTPLHTLTSNVNLPTYHYIRNTYTYHLHLPSTITYIPPSTITIHYSSYCFTASERFRQSQVNYVLNHSHHALPSILSYFPPAFRAFLVSFSKSGSTFGLISPLVYVKFLVLLLLVRIFLASTYLTIYSYLFIFLIFLVYYYPSTHNRIRF